MYAKTHEWVSISEDGGEKVATVGISAFAVEALTDLVFIELPKVGAQVEAGAAVLRSRIGQGGQRRLRPGRRRGDRGQQSASRQPRDPQHRSLRRRLDRQDPHQRRIDLGNLLDYAAYQKQCAEEPTDTRSGERAECLAAPSCDPASSLALPALALIRSNQHSPT